MEHNEYIREGAAKKTAVLFIHGILGTPRHFDRFIPIIPKDWSIYNILLDGHGRGVSEFSKTSMKKWKNQVGNICDRLSGDYKQVVIIAHSIGALLSLGEAIKNPQKIKALILLAVPLKIAVKSSAIKNSLKVALERVDINDAATVAAREACSIKTDKRLWRYLGWAPRFLELFGLARRVRRVVSSLKVPCYTFFSRKDELVSLKSARYTPKNENTKNYFLKNSGHYYYDPLDFMEMRARIEEIISDI